MSTARGPDSGSSNPFFRHAPLALATAALAYVTARAVLTKVGGPGAPLDDSYIHFQYARSLAELHPFRYTAGAAPTPGATSLLWPLLLSPFYALGLHADRLIFAAWALGFVSLALLALEVRMLAEGLMESPVAVAAGAMVLAFGGFVWFSASGMEVVPFALLVTRAARRAAEWVEGSGKARPEDARELVVLATLCPLMRPEGAVASLLVAGALAWSPRGKLRYAILSLLGPLVPPLVCFAATGQAVQSTALAKWLPLNPYYGRQLLLGTVTVNVRLFFDTLLDGRSWTSVFLPSGGRLVLALGLPALAIQGVARRRLPRALMTLVVALAILIPTTYETFLVNRVRYIWPFFGAWIVGLAALSDLAGHALDSALERLGGRKVGVPLLLSGALIGLFSSRLPASIDDLAESTRAVSLQQVALARWVKAALPGDARVGVNDTGAMAYLGGHSTFDVVGLTTRGEARYWTAGAGSRFEHYESLPRDFLPTHFVVYPEWFAIDALLGAELTSRSVSHTILGGTTMAAYVARYDALGSGERPSDVSVAGRRLVDALDVADLESEGRHGYRLFDATQAEDVVVEELGHADGARRERRRDRFSLRLAKSGTLVARLGARAPVRIRFLSGGRTLGSVELDAEAWQEVEVHLPEGVTSGDALLDVAADEGTFDALHYWSYE